MNFVFVPALGCDERLYLPVISLLGIEAGSQTAIARGDRLSACVEEVLNGAPQRFVLVGTSFGGRVALETAVAAQDRLAGLVVIGAGAGPSPDRTLGLKRSERLRGREFEAVVSEMADIISHLPGPQGAETRRAFIAMARRQGGELMARQSDALAHRGDLWPRLPEISCPALMLWGRNDQFVPASDGLRMSAAVKSGRYAELPECGHFPTLEYPEASASAIEHWLRDNRLT